MGIETGLILSAAVATAGVIAQTVQASRARKAQREAQAISGASEEIKNRAARRRAAREARIRRARIIQSAETSGGEGSSGLVGSLSALGSNFASAVANQKSGELASQGISRASQSAADARSRSGQIGAFTKIAGIGVKLAFPGSDDDDSDLFEVT